MGKATRWFKALLGLKRSDPAPRQPDPPPLKPNRRWSFVKSYREKSSLPPPTSDDAGKHAIVVAAASAAAAEAALAAAQAAAEVVRLTTSGRRTAAAPPAHVNIRGAREASAAVVIQSQFRGYLARRALKALKGLVKLQALVRGHVVRKKTKETMRCIQAMLRAQARARSVRAHDSPSSSGKSSRTHRHHHNHPGPITPEKFELKVPTPSLPSTRGVGSRLGFEPLTHPDKIVEIDIGRPPRLGPPRRRRSLVEPKPLDFGSDKLSQSLTTTMSKENSTVLSSASCEVQSSRRLNPPDLSPDDDNDGVFCDASATSCFSGHSECPSYMADTESSKARTRSLSAPRQRPHHYDYERASSAKRWTAHQRVDSSAAAAMRTSFVSRAYPGSGHLDRLGMPVRSGGMVYYSGCLN